MADVNFQWDKKGWLLPEITKNATRNEIEICQVQELHKEIKQNLNAIQYEELTPTLQNVAYKTIVNNVNERYEVMNIYYEHLQEVYDIVWRDTSDKEGKNFTGNPGESIWNDHRNKYKQKK